MNEHYIKLVIANTLLRTLALVYNIAGFLFYACFKNILGR